MKSHEKMRVMVSRNIRLTSRQVNLSLEFLVSGVIFTGLVSWSVGDRLSGWFTFAHGALGITIALLIPLKLRGPVRNGFQRGRTTRWVSSLFGLLVLAALALGLLHATGLWYGVGYWSALWTHELVGFSIIPFYLWHVFSRPVRPRVSDLDRRGFLRFAGLLTVAAGLHVVQRPLSSSIGLAGGNRRSTGSHEIASHDPMQMPTVIWLNDNRPANTTSDGWPLTIEGEAVTIDELRSKAMPVVATLDCTGGWYSEQAWDAVPLSDLIPTPAGRSVHVESATGYGRHFATSELSKVYLAVGYQGLPLRRGHGAPVRLVVPGRRGPEWIKWVTSVSSTDRPAWLQAPLPLS